MNEIVPFSILNLVQNMNITLIPAPSDLRKGYKSLERICCALGVDLSKGKDVVVFVSKSHRLAKLVFTDANNSYCLSCYPHHGSYQRLLVMASNSTQKQAITNIELSMYLSGEPIQSERTSLII